MRRRRSACPDSEEEFDKDDEEEDVDEEQARVAFTCPHLQPSIPAANHAFRALQSFNEEYYMIEGARVRVCTKQTELEQKFRVMQQLLRNKGRRSSNFTENVKASAGKVMIIENRIRLKGGDYAKVKWARQPADVSATELLLPLSCLSWHAPS